MGTFLLSFLTSGWEPDYGRQGRSGAMETVICKTATAVCFGSGGAAAMALRAACSGIEIQDCTHPPDHAGRNGPNEIVILLCDRGTANWSVSWVGSGGFASVGKNDNTV